MDNAKKLLADIRPPFFIISSIASQILLIPWSNQRIRNGSRSPFIRTIWFAVHSTADYFATLSLWFIFHVYIDNKIEVKQGNKSYLAFWAPFTLLHLGRHGKITAFSLQDNEFWPKHAVGFLIYVCTTLFICILAPIEVPMVWPSVIIFIVGTFKFGERIWSLYHSSIKRMNSIHEKPDSGGLDFMEIASRVNPTHRQGEPMVIYPDDLLIDIGPSTTHLLQRIHSSDQRVISLCKAYNFFTRYKGLYAGVRLISIVTETPQDPFLNPDRLIEIELGFAHDLFYGKSIVTHTLTGMVFRLPIIVLTLVAAILYSSKDQHGLYTIFLPIITFILELASLFDALFSKWMLIDAAFREGEKWRKLEQGILRIRGPTMENLLFPSLKLGQHSIFSFCSSDRYPESKVNQVLDFFEVKEFWNNIKHTHHIPFDNVLKHQISTAISNRLRNEWDLITASKNPILAPLSVELVNVVGDGMNFHVTDRKLEFGEAIIVWHLATDLCYDAFQPQPPYLEHAKVISDYMLYLVIDRPETLSPVLKPQNSYQDACATVSKFIARRDNNGDRRHYYETLEDIDATVEQPEADNLLLYGFKVSRRLREMAETNEETWNFLFKVWVNLLSHAAFYCKGQDHAAQLNTGGELLTFVWVFLLHCFMGSDC